MFQSARVLSLALAAAVLLPGCATVAGPVVKPPVKPPVVKPALKAGTVRVSFPGLKPATPVFRTLATRSDIAAVELILIDGRGQKQLRRLERAELWVPLVQIGFDKVPVGQIEFLVQAFDDEGNTIGQATQVDQVQANQTTVMNLAVKLAPGAGTGDVTAVIDFIDGDPAPACGAEAFFRADRNQDGQLDLDEYLGGYPFATCDEPVLRPMPVDRLPVPTTTGTSASGTPKGYAVACMAPMPPDMHPGVAEFQARDLSQDGLLSLDEFLGQVAPPPPPVDPCEEAFHALDADADGRLLFQEWMMGRPVPMIGAPEGFPRRLPPFDAAMRREFRSLDLNGDGALDLAEHCGWGAVLSVSSPRATDGTSPAATPAPPATAASGSQPRTK